MNTEEIKLKITELASKHQETDNDDDAELFEMEAEDLIIAYSEDKGYLINGFPTEKRKLPEEELEEDPSPIPAESVGEPGSETHNPAIPPMSTPETAAAKAPEATHPPAGPPISLAQTNYLLRLTKALPLTEDDLRMKVRALTQREASGLIKRLIAQDFSYFTSSPNAPPATPVNTGSAADTMTDPQFKKIMGLVLSMGIPEPHVKSLTAGYTKRQASTLIDQLVGGDFSAFQEIKEEELPVLTTPKPTPVEERVGF